MASASSAEVKSAPSWGRDFMTEPRLQTLEVAQELYDGQGKKIITYPRAEVRYLH